MQRVFKLIVDELKKAAGSELKIYGGARSNGKSILLGYYKGLEDAVTIVNSVIKQYNNGWIPVSERLPEKNEYVLVSVKQSMANHNPVIIEYLGQSFWYDGTIEAWMPLPAPYKEGES